MLFYTVLGVFPTGRDDLAVILLYTLVSSFDAESANSMLISALVREPSSSSGTISIRSSSINSYSFKETFMA